MAFPERPLAAAYCLMLCPPSCCALLHAPGPLACLSTCMASTRLHARRKRTLPSAWLPYSSLAGGPCAEPICARAWLISCPPRVHVQALILELHGQTEDAGISMLHNTGSHLDPPPHPLSHPRCTLFACTAGPMYLGVLTGVGGKEKYSIPAVLHPSIDRLLKALNFGDCALLGNEARGRLLACTHWCIMLGAGTPGAALTQVLLSHPVLPLVQGHPTGRFLVKSGPLTMPHTVPRHTVPRPGWMCAEFDAGGVRGRRRAYFCAPRERCPCQITFAPGPLLCRVCRT
jgi:hypothetical protein